MTNIIGGSKPQATFDFSLAKNIECESCKFGLFNTAFIIKKISALQSGSGREELVPIQTYVCYNCGHINDIFNPDKVDIE